MKDIYKTLFALLILSSIIVINGCDPFEDFYIMLSMDTEMNSFGAGQSINITSDLCLSDFSDYTDNQDKLQEIRYVTTAYTTISATQGLRGDNARIRIYQSDGTTLLAEYSIPTFVAADYVDHPLEIKFTQQQVDDLNRYLANHQVNNCFKAVFQISNVQYQGTVYSLSAKFEFLAQLKVKP
jgi:hypothetical protein